MTATDAAAAHTPALDEPRSARWRTLLAGSSTPARLRRWAAVLVVGCLAIAVVSAVAGSARSDAAGSDGARLATLDFDTSELYDSLNGANASAATGFGADRTASPTMLARYDSYITGASLRLQHAEGLLELDGPDAALAESIGYELPRYTTGVDAARALRDQGSPRAAAQLDSAEQLMTSTILPAADTLQQDRRVALAADYEQAGGFPLVVTILAVVVLVAVVWLSVREARRTKRVINVGMAVAGVLLAVALVWWLTATGIAGGRLATAREHNAAASTLGQARVLMLQARAAETAAVADSGPGGITPAAGDGLQRQLTGAFGAVLGPGGQLDGVENTAGRSPAVDTIRGTAAAWQEALRSQGAGSDASRVMFVRLTSALGDGISTEQGERTAAIDTTDTALTGLGLGPALLALLAAGAVAAGIAPRLREYR